jgi:hypothetical protein
VVDVIRCAAEPRLVNLPRHEASFLKAMPIALGGQAPEPELIRAFSRAVADPSSALEKLSAPLDWTGSVKGSVSSVRVDILSIGILPGPQPRGLTGKDFRSAREPIVGHTDSGQIRLTFRGVGHLRTWLHDSIARTFARAVNKKGRHLEVAATGVRRDVTCHLAVLSFDDGTPDQHVVLVRDGISRWVSSHVLRRGLHGSTAGEAAWQLVDELVPHDKVENTADARALSKHLYRVASKAQQEYEANKMATGVTERGLLLQQSLTMPATVYLALAQGADGMAAAMDRIVADMHTDVDRWGMEDADYHNVRTIFDSMYEKGVLDEDLYELISTGGPDLGETPRGPLQRAVEIAAFAMGGGFEGVKNEMRQQGVLSRVHAKRVSELLGPLLSEPWSRFKGVGTVWGYEGALPSVPKDIELTHPADYLQLVKPALEGELDAKYELRLAGGVALVSNGVINTSLVGGSGGSKNSRRMALNTLFERLTNTEYGLTQLAIAANAFRPDEMPERNPLPAVDMTREDRQKVDGASIPIGVAGRGGLTGQELATIFAEANRDDEGDSDDTDPDPAKLAQMKLNDAVDELTTSIPALKDLLERIAKLRIEAGRSDQLIASEKAETMSRELFDLARVVSRLDHAL